MKRYLIFGVIFAALLLLLLLLWPGRSGNTSTPDISEAAPQPLATTNSVGRAYASNVAAEPTPAQSGSADIVSSTLRSGAW